MSTSLYVSNLAFSTTEDMLVGRFSEFGTVLSVKLRRDLQTGALHCHGLVKMRTTAEAHAAAARLNATRLDGRLVSVHRATHG